MEKAELNKNMHLSEHFTLGEVTKTSVKTANGRSATQGDALLAKNIPSHVAIENLKNLCENWLEDLRYSYNTLYPSCHLERSREISPRATLGRDDNPIIITSGYRSPEVNRAVGGSPTSNHLTGCAVDIRCEGFEQALRYANILLDISDGTKQDYDELFIERSKQGRYWIHFAVRPKDNRRKTAFILT
ncbi:Peptidase M15 [Prevotella sp. ne3005]|uniref:D-Ala-D-Ala carboxypeptidase family metallohydrolase n=1 Tax=Prevotella sp. ne3005 TaxID=1761887 RepID=UPI0008ACB035|nr:D-Ala-D-Ala carboxypeptidase family metallohydrolase [Prevotella sp. ne3005]SEN38551.1 Peptidase M15 [Prevotella sp. ne3005]